VVDRSLLALDPDELGPLRLAVLLEPVRVHQPRGVILRRVENGAKDSHIIHQHLPRLQAQGRPPQCFTRYISSTQPFLKGLHSRSCKSTWRPSGGNSGIPEPSNTGWMFKPISSITSASSSDFASSPPPSTQIPLPSWFFSLPRNAAASSAMTCTAGSGLSPSVREHT